MRPACPRLISLSVACCAALLLALPAQAATPGAKPDAKSRPASKLATPRQQLKSEAKGLALAAETVESISEGQLAVASRVLTGAADCEFNQQISVQPLDGVPGYFTVSHKGKRYRMLPRETATGAVRLEDPAAGVVWLQIPTKSMLMNARVGQRLVDNCLLSEQRIAVHAAVDPGQGIGIVVPVAAAAPVEAVTPVATVAPVMPVAPAIPAVTGTPMALAVPVASVMPATTAATVGSAEPAGAAASTPASPAVSATPAATSDAPAAAAEPPAAASAPATR